MGHKKQVTYQIKPSPQQQHAAEFRRTIKDCSTVELDYRMSVNQNTAASITLDVIEAQAKLTYGRQNLATLAREHAVLTAEIEGRR